ncbi:hypothetical protein [Devosia sp. SL43]|uniref:hypothetical protein n=1 Tax=Devosia sp. SL43 TaxID=2806348 RepID=UPI001F45CDB7|nr:hypothetical protein [Devosia sp. SL43]UJW87960.1 hypothetical protein IM737_20615 [Devosia sp. SL43]
MTNPLKGEGLARIEAGEYTLAFTLGACVAIETHFDGKPLQDITAELSGETVNLSVLLVVLWALLRKHHGLTLQEVEDLVTITEIPIWSEALTTSMVNAQPKGKGARPPRAAAG